MQMQALANITDSKVMIALRAIIFITWVGRLSGESTEFNLVYVGNAEFG
jgi:hypothetical protein